MKTTILAASIIIFGIIGVIVGIYSGKNYERRYTNLCLRIGKKFSTIEWFYRRGYASSLELARADGIMVSAVLSPKEIEGHLNDILKDISAHVSGEDLDNQIQDFQQFISNK